MTGWPDIVTTALLGTGRRPLAAALPPWAHVAGLDEGGDVEGRVLDLAAVHRIAVQAGRLAQFSGGPNAFPATVPRQLLPIAPSAARHLLDGFLARPDAATINLWLAACRHQGCGLAPQHWTQVVALSARSTAYDRDCLAVVLGARGRWFVGQNRDWRKLASVLAAAGGRPAVAAASPQSQPTTQQVEKNPELLTAVADPWPDRLVTAAIAGLVDPQMGTKWRPYARVLGSRLTRAQYASLGVLATGFLELAHLGPAARRGVRNLFVEIERAARDRIEIEHAFDPSSKRILEITIPPV